MKLALAALLLLVACGGEEPQPLRGVIAADPVTVGFGTVPEGTPSTRELVLSNVGDGPLSLFSFAEEDDRFDAFSFMIPGATTLPPGGRLIIPITFQPRRPGWRDSATLRITNSDEDRPNLGVAIFGTTLRP